MIYLGIARVISGGQTGADQAGLAAAAAVGIKTGGWAPRGYMTEAGSDPRLATVYGLTEHFKGYGERTDANARLADGTIRFAAVWQSPGEKRTLKAIQRFRKPYIDVDVNAPRPAEEVVQWIRDYKIKILNVAGNSQSRAPGIYQFVYEYLQRVLLAVVNGEVR